MLPSPQREMYRVAFIGTLVFAAASPAQTRAEARVLEPFAQQSPPAATTRAGQQELERALGQKVTK